MNAVGIISAIQCLTSLSEHSRISFVLSTFYVQFLGNVVYSGDENFAKNRSINCIGK